MSKCREDAAPKADGCHGLSALRRTAVLDRVEFHPANDGGRDAEDRAAAEKSGDREDHRDHWFLRLSGNGVLAAHHRTA